jgi:anti-sigma regulatory factor (Ser/Thr protein kinase)
VSTATSALTSTLTPFRHDALLYGADREFLDGTLEFLNEGLEANESMLVVLAAEKIDALERELGDDAGRVRFADMAEVGANPARIIPAWRDFADECMRRGVPFRGIGEPIWPGRSADELVECQRHEALLNLAFADTPGFRLLCPYDTSNLHQDVLEEAHRSHPCVVEGSSERESGGWSGLDEVVAPFDAPLPEPARVLAAIAIDRHTLRNARALVTHHATESGLSAEKLDDLLIAVSEVVTNSILHGGGAADLRIWHSDPSLVCEVRDTGFIQDPLAGRVRPAIAGVGGRGLWLATQLCDLLQLRATEAGNVIRLHMRTA